MRCSQWVVRLVGTAGAALLLGAGALYLLLIQHAERVAVAAPTGGADAVVVLGNRVWIDGAPNPCLASRVQAAVTWAQTHPAPLLLMSGGTDAEDGRNESQAMQALGQAAGFTGPILREARSQSTRENLLFSRPILRAAGVRRVLVVSEPFHLWRVQRLAAASGLEREFQVQYLASAPCRSWGRQRRMELREVAAIVNNGLRGDY